MIYTGKKVYDPLTDTYSTGYWIKDKKRKGWSKMKVYCALKFKPFGEEQLVGIAKTQKGALAILKREFPYMSGKIENKNLASDANNTYLLDVREVEVEGCYR